MEKRTRAFNTPSIIIILSTRDSKQPDERISIETYLYDGLSSGDLENLTLSGLSVSKLDVDDLGISNVNDNQELKRSC